MHQTVILRDFLAMGLPMSQLGQGPPWPADGWHSRSTPSSGNKRAFRHLRFVPTAEVAGSLDHLVDDGERSPYPPMTDTNERSSICTAATVSSSHPRPFSRGLH